MLDASIRAAISKRMMPLRIIHIALLSSVAIYGIVGFVLQTTGEPPPASELPLLIFPALAASMLVVSFLMRGLMLKKARAAAPQVVSPEQVGPFMVQAQSAFIIGWALCESAAIFGLVAFLLSHDWRWFLPCLLGSALALLAQVPTERTIEQLLER